MGKLSLAKSEWVGNKWPSVDINPYEDVDFYKVLVHLCRVFSLSLPTVIDTHIGVVCDLSIDGVSVAILMDNWTFSVAAETVDVRDQIFDALEKLET